MLAADVDQLVDLVVAAAGLRHERQAQGIPGVLQGARGVEGYVLNGAHCTHSFAILRSLKFVASQLWGFSSGASG